MFVSSTRSNRTWQHAAAPHPTTRLIQPQPTSQQHAEVLAPVLEQAASPVAQSSDEQYVELKLNELHQLETLLAQAQAMMQAERDEHRGYIVEPVRATQHTQTAWELVAARCRQQMQLIRDSIPALLRHEAMKEVASTTVQTTTT